MRGWHGQWSPSFVGADYTAAGSYQCDGYRLYVNVVQYVEQHQGKEAVGEFNHVIPRKWWNDTTRQQRQVTSKLTVNEYRVERTSRQLTIWNWYAVGLQPTPSQLMTKALEAFNALTLHRKATSNITVAVEADPRFDATKVLTRDTDHIWTWFEAGMKSNG